MITLNFLPLDFARAFAPGLPSLQCSFNILYKRLVAGCIEQYVRCSKLNTLWMDSAPCSP